MASVEKKVIDQFSEIVETPLKNYMERKNIRKSMLTNYGTQKEIELIDQIMSSDAVSLEHKAFLTAYIKNGAKKFYNQLKILDIALDNLETQSNKIVSVDKDWINDFWEKAKNISDKDNQTIWANILSFNFIEGCCTKTLLNALYLLDKRNMYFFDTVRKFSFKHVTDVNRIYSCIFFTDDSDVYKNYGLYRFAIQQLAILGLVEFDWSDEFRLPTTDIELIYGTQKVRLNSYRKAQYGNVRYTSDGALLFRALSPIEDMNCFEYCLEKWDSRGIMIFR